MVGPEGIASLDPWGHVPRSLWAEQLASGDFDLRPTIAVTKSHLDFPEIKDALDQERLAADAHVLSADGQLVTTKAAVELVWYLPVVARRFGIDEAHLRRVLYEQTGVMFPELITRPELKAFLPADQRHHRVHHRRRGVDTAGGGATGGAAARRRLSDSDLFCTDASNGRQWLAFGIEECVRAAQAGGAGLIVYSRQEGYALGEVAKFLVHNARQKLGDSVDNLFSQQHRVSGGRDLRLFELSGDVLL